MRLRQLLEMVRFSHTVFALPFALLAAVMAWTTPVVTSSANSTGELQGPTGFRWSQLMGIVACMVCARSAAMSFNRIVDRKLDAANPRTKMRHLPAGIIPVHSAVVFTVISSIGFFAGTLLFWPNPLPVVLALPVLGFLLAYSYTKRFTALSHFWLGAALMLAPVSAWIAIRGQVILQSPTDLFPALYLGMSVLLWVAGFDMIYACQDVRYDIQSRLHSVPAAIGVTGALRLAAVCHAGTVCLLLLLPWLCPQLNLGWVYSSGIVLVSAMLVYEHALVSPTDLRRVNMAFFNVNAIISIGVLIAGTVDLLT